MNCPKKCAALFALIVLAACAPDVVKQPVPVDIAVGVPCRAPAIAVPGFATASVKLTDTPFIQARALAATNEQRKAYEAKLTAALKACQ